MARGVKAKKALARLKVRIADYEKTCKEANGGRGYNRPGSMNGRK